MAYKLYDFDGNQVEQKDLQDKQWWCRDGEKKENVFVDTFGEQLNLIINPEKKHNPYAPDLMYKGARTSKLGDLKTQNTPFFQAHKYGLPLQTTVTFNVIDYERYTARYTDFLIYFSVNWLVESIVFEFDDGGTSRKTVMPMQGIWGISLKNIRQLVEDQEAPIHEYQQRIEDQNGNAKNSYLFDLTNKLFKKLKVE